jgi:membrane-bound lytic murein transglycosylase MltF
VSPAEAPETVAEIDDPWLRPGRAHEWTGDLDGMVERGVVRVLTTANRTDFFVDGARKRGIVAASAAALEEMLNKQLGQRDAVDVVVVPVRRDQLLPMLTKGLGDVVIGNLTITPERQEIVDFASPFVSDVRELVVTAPGTDPVATLEDLSGRPVWVRRSSSYHASLQALNRRFASEGREPVDVRAADEVLEDNDILEMVQANLYPATVVDSHKLEWVWARVFPELNVSDVAVREKGAVAAATRKNSPRLQALLADFYERHRVRTSFGNQMVQRYFKSSPWINDAAATQERRKYAAVVDLFRKYSEHYDFDYLMMIAQGYQELGLDPDARSRVGAIGIMQVMPATAAGPPIHMPNVEAPEPNIHAGIKYMRWVVDEYFDDPAIDDVNRHLFAFAAYNAGPNRIARLRKLAPEYDVDPNVWFQNVERIVASRVSREPVRYVRNIYKYYLAYRRLRDVEKERGGAERR